MADELSGDREQLLRDAVDVDEAVARLLQLGHSAYDSGDYELARTAFRAAATILELIDTDD